MSAPTGRGSATLWELLVGFRSLRTCLPVGQSHNPGCPCSWWAAKCVLFRCPFFCSCLCVFLRARRVAGGRLYVIAPYFTFRNQHVDFLDRCMCNSISRTSCASPLSFTGEGILLPTSLAHCPGLSLSISVSMYVRASCVKHEFLKLLACQVCMFFVSCWPVATRDGHILCLATR